MIKKPTKKQLDPIKRHAEEEKQAQIKREHKELVKRLTDAESRERRRDALHRYQIKPVKRRELGSGLRNMTAVALLSDLHVEQEVTLERTAGYNWSNLEKSEIKLGRFWSGLQWQIEHERADKKLSIRDLVLWLGGDLMTGAIHDDSHRELTPLNTMRWCKRHIASGISQLLEDPKLESIKIPCSFGNHDRDTKYANYATGAEHSYAWQIYQELADIFEGEKRIEFLADTSEFQYVKVYKYDLAFHHGHRIKYGGGVGGVTIPTRKAVAQWQKVRHADLWHFGHFHTYYDFEDICGNGSLVGYDEFAMGIKASPEPPCQAFYLLDENRGKTCKCPLWVEP